MYLTAFEAEQSSPPSYELNCQVELRWRYDQEPQVMEFWWRGGSDEGDPGERWRNQVAPQYVAVDTSKDIAHASVTVPAGEAGMIIACPRMLDDSGALDYWTPDADDTKQPWKNFCVSTPFTGERLDGKPRDRCRVAPEITGLEVGYGSVTVRWTNPEGYDEFVVHFSAPDSGGDATPYWTPNTEYRFEKVARGGCWARVAGVHAGNSWTGTQRCESPLSSFNETSVPPELGYVEARFDPGAPVGAVARTAEHSEVFGCLPDGRPVAIWRHAEPWWHPWYGHGDGPGFPGGAWLTAVARSDDLMDLFGVASNGSVYLAWWNGNPWREWFVLSGASFLPGSRIAAVSRNPNQMDIFAAGTDGVVRSTWWNGDPWQEWFELDGADVPPGAPIAAASRNPNQMDVFATGTDGIVRSNWWNGNPWRGWFALDGADFPPGAPIAAQSVGPDSQAIAAVGVDGKARINAWDGTWKGWRIVPSGDFPPGAPLTVAGRLLLGVANDGYVRACSFGQLNPYWLKVG
jgi:hypothetical protein